MKPEQVFFTSDHHFNHNFLAKHRGYSSKWEMNKDIISKWNEKVGDTHDPHVFMLGDVHFEHHRDARQILEQLRGNKYLILGNHDKPGRINPIRDMFIWVKDTHSIKVEDAESRFSVGGNTVIFLFHYACRVWKGSFRGALHLYGHSHGNLPEDPNSLSLEVSLECNNMYPFSYREVIERMEKKTWVRPRDREAHDGAGSLTNREAKLLHLCRNNPENPLSKEIETLLLETTREPKSS